MTIKSKNNIFPVGERVLIEILEPENNKYNNIVVINSSKEEDKLRYAIIIRVSEEVKDFAPNDKVLFGKWAGSSLFIDNIEYVIIKKTEIVAKIIKEE